MHDLKQIRSAPDAFDTALARRGIEPQSPLILEMDERRRALQTEAQSLQGRRNDVSKRIGQVKKAGGDAQPMMDEVAGIKARLAELEAEEGRLGEELNGVVAGLPNVLAEDVPEGPDEDSNVEIKRFGAPVILNASKEHYDLGEGLGQMDFEGAAALSGARFVVLKRDIARLSRALGQFMLDTHVDDHGYEEVIPPYLVRDHVVYGTGQLPKFAEDLFHIPDTGHWLIPTAEVPLTNLVAAKITEAESLPLRFTALSPCFRSEAGSAGRDTRGMIRQHQFEKVELVSVTEPDRSEEEHERMLSCAEAVLQKLDLAYRIVMLCSGDTGFGARKTYDIEVWLPGQNAYREISSCSNCGDFQARRMNARTRAKSEKATRFLHTLNGSGVAVGRALIAVMETYQTGAGGVEIPSVLQPYMGGKTRIGE